MHRQIFSAFSMRSHILSTHSACTKNTKWRISVTKIFFSSPQVTYSDRIYWCLKMGRKSHTWAPLSCKQYLFFFVYSFQEELARDEAQSLKKDIEIGVILENKEEAREEYLMTPSEEALKQDEKNVGYFKPHVGVDSKKLKEYTDWKAGKRPGSSEEVPEVSRLL
jgi:hypothetical protein